MTPQGQKEREREREEELDRSDGELLLVSVAAGLSSGGGGVDLLVGQAVLQQAGGGDGVDGRRRVLEVRHLGLQHGAVGGEDGGRDVEVEGDAEEEVHLQVVHLHQADPSHPREVGVVVASALTTNIRQIFSSRTRESFVRDRRINSSSKLILTAMVNCGGGEDVDLHSCPRDQLEMARASLAPVGGVPVENPNNGGKKYRAGWGPHGWYTHSGGGP